MNKNRNTEQLDEISGVMNWFKNFRAPGKAQNVAGRTELKQAQEEMFGALQNYLGKRDMRLTDLTPQVFAKFLNTNDISVSADQIPSVGGKVKTSTARDVIKNISIQLVTGETPTYVNPRKSVLPQVSTQPAAQSSTTSDPNKKTKKLKKAKKSNAQSSTPSNVPSPQNTTPEPPSRIDDLITKLRDLTIDLPANKQMDVIDRFIAMLGARAQEPPAAQSPAAQSPAAQSPAATQEPPAAQSPAATQEPPAAQSSEPAPPKQSRRNKNKSTSTPQDDIPVMPAGGTNYPKNQEPAAATSTPAKTSTAVKTTKPKSAETPTSKKAKPAIKTIIRNGQRISLPDYPTKEESIKRTIKAIREGKQLSAGIKIKANHYKYFVKLLEAMNLTLKDIGLWRVLKESTDQYVILQTR